LAVLASWREFFDSDSDTDPDADGRQAEA